MTGERTVAVKCTPRRRAWRRAPRSKPRAPDRCSGAGLLCRRLLRFRRSGRLRAAFDRIEASGGETVDARPRAAHEGHGHGALAALVDADLDVVGRAGTADDLALGHLQRDAGLHEPGLPGGRTARSD